MTCRTDAERVLAGRVNDWVAEAQSLARHVAELCDRADADAVAHAATVDVLGANAAAAQSRMVAASVSAQAAVLRAEDAEGERARLRARIHALEVAAANLNDQIVVVPEGRQLVVRVETRWMFKYGAGDAITSFRKAVGIG